MPPTESRFQVCRLNHSATLSTTVYLKNTYMNQPSDTTRHPTEQQTSKKRQKRVCPQSRGHPAPGKQLLETRSAIGQMNQPISICSTDTLKETQILFPSQGL